ncbi:ATP-binding protein [Photobacterium sp. J15]|uniref:ATP-binding protein n=1 Tax=Photobacterium sp. J15 TaxID=265901 RepID=UPI0007E39AD3|nr:DUF3404 domain-containing protein [Photobacterium sp. J15]
MPKDLLSLVVILRKPLLIFSLFLFFSLSAVAESDTIEVRFQRFLKSISEISAHPLITRIELESYPRLLLTLKSQYPDLKRYNWSQIQFLYQFHLTCRFELTNDIGRGLERAIEFELTLCAQQRLNEVWFTGSDLLHPAGGSYADRYLDYLKEYAEPQEVQLFENKHRRLLTIANSQHPLHKRLSKLSPSGQDVLLISGARYFLNKDGSLWRNTQQGIDWIEAEKWQSMAKEQGLLVTPSSSESGSVCTMQYSNLCVALDLQKNLVVYGVISFFVMLSSGLLLRLIWERRQEAKERQFILQLLTHELRTPVASLGITVEQFRDGFDRLDEVNQLAFWRLMEDYQRLSRLTETSKGFLSQNNEDMLLMQTAYVSEWLDSLTEKYDLSYSLTGDKSLSLPYYWLGVCADNLIRNAICHGKPPVELTVTVTDSLLIEVSDNGEPLAWWQRRPSAARDNMGLGLFIVRRLMKKMGGRMHYRSNPTCYTLELPL